MNNETLLLKKEEIRLRLKSLFSLHLHKDPIYSLYHAIDQNVKIDKLKSSKSRTAILRITELFSAFNFFESSFSFIRDGYLNYNNIRRGILTDGVLFKTQTNANSESIGLIQGYTINELSLLTEKQLHEIFQKIKYQYEPGSARNDKYIWYFWGGCEMKFPKNTTIVLSNNISEVKICMLKKTPEKEDEKGEVILDTRLTGVDFIITGQNEFYQINDRKTNLQINTDIKNKDINKAISLVETQTKLSSGTGLYTNYSLEPIYTSISGKDKPTPITADTKELDLALLQGELYEYILFIPYLAPVYDKNTNYKIFSSQKSNPQVDELLIVTCT